MKEINTRKILHQKQDMEKKQKEIRGKFWTIKRKSQKDP